MTFEPFQLRDSEINAVQAIQTSNPQYKNRFIGSSLPNMAFCVYMIYALMILVFERSVVKASKDFYIRHYCGFCMKPDRAGTLTLRFRCMFKFQWQGGGRLVASQKCLAANGSNDGTSILFTDQCSGVNSLFQYLPASKSIKHLKSGKCLTPDRSKPENAKVVLGSCQPSSSNRFWLFPQQMYIIRHHKSGTCIRLDKTDALFKLYPGRICDRFTGTLVHVKTGKCMGDGGKYIPHKVSTSD